MKKSIRKGNAFQNSIAEKLMVEATIEPTHLPRSEQLLRLNQIIGKDGLLPISRAKFYELVKQGALPRPIKLSARISCWRRADILDFIGYRETGGH